MRSTGHAARSSPTLGPHDAERGAADASALLSVRDLSVTFDGARGRVQAIDRVSIEVKAGEVLAIVGESGSGKSVTSLALTRLLPRTARIEATQVELAGVDLACLTDTQMRHVRGRQIGTVFQEPMTALNPVIAIGEQIIEPLRWHLGVDRQRARARALELLALVGISDPELRLRQYPHQLSGGMRQRVMIAIALACSPKLLIADEPTTALDVTIQAQILELMQGLVQRLGIGLVLITHNFGIVARYADRVAVMYAGRIVEEGPTGRIFALPGHPYTQGLIRSVPRIDRARLGRLDTIEGMPPNLAEAPSGCRFAPRCAFRVAACADQPPLRDIGDGQRAACVQAPAVARGQMTSLATALPRGDCNRTSPLLVVEDVRRSFSFGGWRGRRVVTAVAGVSFSIARGETFGLIGESGCGKSTVGRLVLGLDRPTKGMVRYAGLDVHAACRADLQRHRRAVQAVFQDPATALNPRKTVGRILEEPLLVHRLAPSAAVARHRAAELLEAVGLPSSMLSRYPHQMSGGQKQRVGIARALTVEPDLIVCDEAVSALDVSVQGQVINLLQDLQRRREISYLFIAHDMAVVRHVAHRIGVMYLGELVESGPADALCAAPFHPYTRALLSAVPIPEPTLARAQAPAIRGEIPSLLRRPKGCVFHTRCPIAIDRCRRERPLSRAAVPGRDVACHLA